MKSDTAAVLKLVGGMDEGGVSDKREVEDDDLPDHFAECDYQSKTEVKVGTDYAAEDGGKEKELNFDGGAFEGGVSGKREAEDDDFQDLFGDFNYQSKTEVNAGKVAYHICTEGKYDMQAPAGGTFYRPAAAAELH